MTEIEEAAPVRQMRLVIEVDDINSASEFFRNGLGLDIEFENEGPGDARVVAFTAGRATLELVNTAQRRYIDDVEQTTTASPRYRIAFEVNDVHSATERATASGAVSLAPPTLTPWRSRNSRLAAPGDVQLTLFQESGQLDTPETST